MLDECNKNARFDIYCDFERPGLVEATLDKRKWVDSEFRSGATDFTELHRRHVLRRCFGSGFVMRPAWRKPVTQSRIVIPQYLRDYGSFTKRWIVEQNHCSHQEACKRFDTFTLLERSIWKVTYDICKPFITGEDETVSSLVLRLVKPTDFKPEALQLASDFILNSYRSRVKSLFNYLYQLQKQINTTKQTIRTFEEILKDISEMELAFLAEIYDRILKDNELPSHNLMDHTKKVCNQDQDHDEFDTLISILCVDLEVSPSLLSTLGQFLPVKHSLMKTQRGYSTQSKKKQKNLSLTQIIKSNDTTKMAIKLLASEGSKADIKDHDLQLAFTKFNNLDVRKQWILKAIANELMLNMGSEKYDISKKNQDFNLIVSKFIGHPMHRQIISAINESRELSDTLLRTLPSEVPETIFIHCSMSPLAKCIATHDIDFMLRRLVSTVKNVGKSKKQFNNFIKELSRNEKRFLNQCAYQTMREAQKHLYDSYAVENLRDDKDCIKRLISDMPDIMESTLKSIIDQKELTSEQSDFMGRMIIEPLISDITGWDAFSKYYKEIVDPDCRRPSNIRAMNSEDMSFYRNKYREFIDQNPDLYQEVIAIQNFRNDLKETVFDTFEWKEKSGETSVHKKLEL